MIVIKKYPNRRLYDTSKSQYVNLETIKELVMQHDDFIVIDSKTENDLTKSILLYSPANYKRARSERPASDTDANSIETTYSILWHRHASVYAAILRAECVGIS